MRCQRARSSPGASQGSATRLGLAPTPAQVPFSSTPRGQKGPACLTCEIGSVSFFKHIPGDFLVGRRLIQVAIKVLQGVAPDNAAHQLPRFACREKRQDEAGKQPLVPKQKGCLIGLER